MAGGGLELSSENALDGVGTSTYLANFLGALHFNYGWVLLVVYVSAFIKDSISADTTCSTPGPESLVGPGGKPLPRRVKKPKAKTPPAHSFTPNRRRTLQFLEVFLLITFLGNLTVGVIHAIQAKHEGGEWFWTKAYGIYIISAVCLNSFFVFSLLKDSQTSPYIAHQATWIVGLVLEIALFVTTTALYTSPHEDANSLQGNVKLVIDSATGWEIIDITIDATRVLIFLLLVGLYAHFSAQVSSNFASSSRVADETTPLLNGNGNRNRLVHSPNNRPDEHGYSSESSSEDGVPVAGDGHIHQENARKTPAEDVPGFYKQKEPPPRGWWEYLKGYTVFFPYLWPHNSLRLRTIVITCFALTLAQRAVNLLLPWAIGRVTNDLYGKNGHTGIPWTSITLFMILRFLQGTNGLLGAARSILWIPISQYSYQELCTASFEHVHSLSLEFHINKQTGEVISALNKGASINAFLEQITFEVLPMLADLAVAIFYFGFAWDAYYAVTVSVVTLMYLYLTVRLAQWRAEERRSMNNLSREEEAVKNDSLQSYETVKYFNAEPFEFGRYRNAVAKFQEKEYEVNYSLSILNVGQNVIFLAGVLLTSIRAAYEITRGDRDVGDFMVLLSYMSQLQAPLNFFGGFYRSIQAAMISGERLLELFKEKPTVVDMPGATDIPECGGRIRFENVRFAYNKDKPALQDLSFTFEPGTTTAFVGESGGGKSTVFRLLFRFYNTEHGSIQIDGRDVKDVTVDSVRRHIGVVPQDTLLFNETIMYNLKYANQDASDEDVYAACRAASIHDKIMSMKKGYESQVGDRGLRLSGGEKQRLAIARALLKNSRIIMLDEATSALDSTTEQNIQNQLQVLSDNHTVLVIAHRLSTIKTADQILVLHAGRVAESGTHEELIAQRGRYYRMWFKQAEAGQALCEAERMMDNAKALQKASEVLGSDDGFIDPSDNEADGHSTKGKKRVGEMFNDGDSTVVGTQVDDTFVGSDDGTAISEPATIIHLPDGDANTSENIRPDTEESIHQSTNHGDAAIPRTIS